MKTFTIALSEQELQVISGIIVAAGSRLGDANIMMAAADAVRLLEQKIKQSEAAPENAEKEKAE